MISISYAGSDRLVLSAVEAKAPEIGSVVAAKMDELDVETVTYIVTEELHGQILNQRSGKLAGSVRPVPASQEGERIIGGVEAAGGPAWYGVIFEKTGAAPHDIVPVRAKALHFFVEGEEVFAKRVHHPGLSTKPFMAPALEVRTPNYLEGIEAAIAAVLER